MDYKLSTDSPSAERCVVQATASSQSDLSRDGTRLMEGSIVMLRPEEILAQLFTR
jgi:hypothetical protein